MVDTSRITADLIAYFNAKAPVSRPVTARTNLLALGVLDSTLKDLVSHIESRYHAGLTKADLSPQWSAATADTARCRSRFTASAASSTLSTHRPRHAARRSPPTAPSHDLRPPRVPSRIAATARQRCYTL